MNEGPSVLIIHKSEVWLYRSFVLLKFSIWIAVYKFVLFNYSNSLINCCDSKYNQTIKQQRKPLRQVNRMLNEMTVALEFAKLGAMHM